MDAVLWDMDGLLVDTEPLWTRAEQELAGSFGQGFTAEMKAAVVGTRLDLAVPGMLRMLGAPADEAQVARTQQRLLDRMVELFTEDLPPKPGAAELLAALHREGVPQALVSSSYRVLVDGVLATGLGPFAVTVAGDEVRDAKPHPEPYLTAAAALGVRPERCVVLEDSPAGIASGEAAGAAVVAVPHAAVAPMPAAPRRLVVRSLAEVDPAALRVLVDRA